MAQHLDFQSIILYIDARCQDNHTGGNLRAVGLPPVRYRIIVYLLARRQCQGKPA